MAQNQTYNGWKNRQTWNVSLWINNDESLYNLAREYTLRHHKAGKRARYMPFVKWARLQGTRTPDNIAFDGSRLDYKELSDMLNEIA